ncbi:MAG: glycerol-3-phosphate acyltransferase [Melioribacteraceae bacterium]|nr:glycerol-3-phosphate acyltransferase [Melioribacteraceae bacterium]MCF8265246.1 glycerol-3-phosphate acyltransferase [Melioribacteraceae bacterium]MCF8413920.1 glycerol-3-phosphate acyltransferase [Melioribacteraceae bacterium]MCF8431143.1 glycerol-3-phosphate acyltransferase [Melioribacteraceae bacterium]
MENILAGIFGYLLGSLPTAFLVMKFAHQKDITKEGSGNVGAMNSFEVSNSVLTGAIVLLIDAGKGFAAVFIASQISDSEFLAMGIALIAAVFAHCYSPWLKFKGGRGLATAAGGSILLAWPILILWGIFWVVAYLFRKHIGLANIMATVLTLFIVFSSTEALNKFAGYQAPNETLFILLSSIMLITILTKHYDPLKEYLDLQKGKSGEKKHEEL